MPPEIMQTLVGSGRGPFIGSSEFNGPFELTPEHIAPLHFANRANVLRNFATLGAATAMQ